MGACGQQYLPLIERLICWPPYLERWLSPQLNVAECETSLVDHLSVSSEDPQGVAEFVSQLADLRIAQRNQNLDLKIYRSWRNHILICCRGIVHEYDAQL